MNRLLRLQKTNTCQRAKKVVSESPGLVDFVIGLVIFVLNLSDGQVLFFWGNSNYRRIVINRVFGLVEMTYGLVHASYSLPEWQAVKLTFFAPCMYTKVCLFHSSISCIFFVRFAKVPNSMRKRL